MPLLNAQQAFRLALSSTDTNLNVADVAGQATKFKGRMNDLLSANSISGSSLAAGAAVLTVVAVGLAYTSMLSRLDQVNDERAGFEDMVEKGISTYFIPSDPQAKTAGDKYIEALIKQLNGFLFVYSGIHQKDIEKDGKKGTVYCVMSTFAYPMGANFEQPQDDIETLDEARQALNLFLTGDLDELLTQIKEKLDNSWITNATLFLQAQRHLKWLNASRFIAIVLGNIVFNLSCPMNPKTDMPLSIEDSAQLCSLFRQIIGSMRSDVHNNEFQSNRDALCCHKELHDFLMILDSKVLALKKAFERNLAHTLNIVDVTNSAHLILRSINTSIRSLVYLGDRYIEPAHLINKVIYLSSLVDSHPELITELVTQLNFEKKVITRMGINQPPTTAIDVLTLFSEATPVVRAKALKHINQKSDTASQFVKTLSAIDTYFLSPIEDKAKTKHFFGLLSRPKSKQSSGRLYFIASVAALLEIFNVTLITKKPSNVNKQVRQINAAAIDDNPMHSVYLLTLLDLTEGTKNKLKEVIRAQYHVLPLLKQIAWIATLIKNNQYYVFTSDFQDFFIKRLQALKHKKQGLIDAINALVETAEDDKRSNKDLLLILSNLNSVNPKTDLSIPKVWATFEKQIQQVIEMLQKSTFDEEAAAHEVYLIDSIEDIDDPSFFSTEAERKAFFQALRSGIKTNGIPVAQSSQQSLSEPVVSRPMSPNFLALPPDDIEPTKSYAFELQAFSVILGLSTALLVTGTVLLILMAFGPQFIPAIAALTAPVASGLVISGFVSAASGGLGLAASYFTPRFFKPTTLAEKDTLTPVTESNEQVGLVSTV
ncbi:MAG: hypothetical protein Q8R83_11205 [Legionellaceae bacterium]|nr:hypothetical protein [Legionellaceae bacterium]